MIVKIKKYRTKDIFEKDEYIQENRYEKMKLCILIGKVLTAGASSAIWCTVKLPITMQAQPWLISFSKVSYNNRKALACRNTTIPLSTEKQSCLSLEKTDGAMCLMSFSETLLRKHQSVQLHCHTCSSRSIIGIPS